MLKVQRHEPDGGGPPGWHHILRSFRSQNGDPKYGLLLALPAFSICAITLRGRLRVLGGMVGDGWVGWWGDGGGGWGGWME